MSDVVPKKRVDFSPHTYRKLLRNLKKTWSNIEYESYLWYAKREGFDTAKVEASKDKFLAMKKDIETKIDLLLERVNTMCENASNGTKDYDYVITCHSVGQDFMLENHLEHLKPAVVFKKVLEPDDRYKYAR